MLRAVSPMEEAKSVWGVKILTDRFRKVYTLFGLTKKARLQM